MLGAGTKLGPYEIVAPLGAVGWARCIAPATRSWTRGRDQGAAGASLAIRNGSRASSAKRKSSPRSIIRTSRQSTVWRSQRRALRSSWNSSRATTLASGSRAGPIPLDEALPIAKQIAEALEAAHEQGIIHRDLKPANIKVRRRHGEGARLRLGEGDGAGGGMSAGDVAASPTITTPAMMTGVGMILGTAAYMAPEQAEGRAADKRADIWAFGCVLYEMLTGKRAFQGEDMCDTLAQCLRGEPDWGRSRGRAAGDPHALQRCLAKDRRQRRRRHRGRAPGPGGRIRDSRCRRRPSPAPQPAVAARRHARGRRGSSPAPCRWHAGLVRHAPA